MLGTGCLCSLYIDEYSQVRSKFSHCAHGVVSLGFELVTEFAYVHCMDRLHMSGFSLSLQTQYFAGPYSDCELS